MAVYVACPACGCKVLMADGALLSTIRCIACDHRFDPSILHDDKPDKPTVPGLTPRRVRPTSQRRHEDDRIPLCPSCCQPVGWESVVCPYCGEELEVETPDERESLASRPRRDVQPHRGTFLTTWGQISLIAGVLAFCTGGVTALVAVPTGLMVLILAQLDLRGMKSNEIDLRGEEATSTARDNALFGLLLGILFGICYAYFWFGM